jgi:sugar/nucleoside kinase (ribokinase family)
MPEIARYEVPFGEDIFWACEEAVRLADQLGKPVAFCFNGTEVVAQPGESMKAVLSRWDAVGIAYLNSPEGKRGRAESLDIRIRDLVRERDRLLAELRNLGSAP